MWQCPDCTLENRADNIVCELCEGTPHVDATLADASNINCNKRPCQNDSADRLQFSPSSIPPPPDTQFVFDEHVPMSYSLDPSEFEVAPVLAVPPEANSSTPSSTLFSNDRVWTENELTQQVQSYAQRLGFRANLIHRNFSVTQGLSYDRCVCSLKLELLTD